MASFRTHFSSGIVLGVLGIFLMLGFGIVGGAGFFAALFIAATVGALAPDMDSDSGVLFHVVFGSLSAILGSVVLLVAIREYGSDIRFIIGLPLAAIVFVWGVFGSLFKRFTRHRGMAHSIPAAILAGLISFSLAGMGRFDEWTAFLIGLASLMGYLLHLVLDEIYAAVNFHGTPFVPNKAFGSALKFTSHDRGITIALYGCIVFLLMGNISRFESLFIRLLGFFQ